MSSIPQYQIYEYDMQKHRFLPHESPEYGLPQYIIYSGIRYVYLGNLGVWIEDEEYCKIIDSHNSYSPNFDPDRRIWNIYDCLSEEFVIKELSLIICQNLSYELDSVIRWIKEPYGFFKTAWEQSYEKTRKPTPATGINSVRSLSDFPNFREVNLDLIEQKR